MLHEPFIKVFFPRDFDGLIVGDMAASIVDVHSRGIDHSWMQKKAAAGIFKDTDISPKDGYSHIHLIALGDADRYGQNRNGDIFYGSGRRVIIPYPEKSASRHIDVQCGNADRVCTFEKHAKVYRNHINKKDSPSYGDIVKAAHNKDMARGELIICVKDDDWSDDLQKLAAGKPIDFSMAARVPYDTCSYCGHKSRSRDEYCEHAKDNMTAITKEGHQVGVINDFHTFFDISRVPVRADRIAQGLLKAASTAEITSRDLLTSMYFSPPPVYDEIANDTFRMKKLAVLRKLAAIEKEIEARGDSIMGSSTAKSLVKSLMPDMSESDMAQFAAGNSESVPEKLAALADVKVILSLPDFMKIVTGPRNAQSVEKETDEAEDRLPGVFNRILSSSDLPDFLDDTLFDDTTLGIVPKKIQDIVGSLGSSHAMTGEPAAKRLSITIIRKLPVNKKNVSSEDGHEKTAAFNKAADRIAEEYARYVLSVCTRSNNSENNGLTESAVMQNYIH